MNYLYIKKDTLSSQRNKSIPSNIDTKNKSKKAPNQKASFDQTADKCYMLNNATLGIHCTRLPKSMEMVDVIKFFNVYGEIDSIGYQPKKRFCDVIYYDIRSSIAAFIALHNYSFDEKHILRINFVGIEYFEKIRKTPFVSLRLINECEDFLPKNDVEQFARSYGDFHLVESTVNGGFIIYFYDSRQCNQCLAKSNIEFNDRFKYVIYPYYNYLSEPIDTAELEDKNNFINKILTTNFDEFDNKIDKYINEQDIQIYTPAPSQYNSFHYRLFISLFNKQPLKDSTIKH